MMKQVLLSAGALGLLFMIGCQTVPYQGQARETKKRPQEGGMISLKENYRPEDRQKADEKMKLNCQPLPFRVLEEGEVVVGQKVETDSRDTKRDDTRSEVGNLFGIPVISGEAGGKDSKSSSTTTALREWQITYQCENKKAKR